MGLSIFECDRYVFHSGLKKTYEQSKIRKDKKVIAEEDDLIYLMNIVELMDAKYVFWFFFLFFVMDFFEKW